MPIILATSDIHGNKKIIEKLRTAAASADIIVVCGDIGGKHFCASSVLELSALQRLDAQSFSAELDAMGKDARFILGNDDWFEYDGEHYLVAPETVCGVQLLPFEFVNITPFNTNREANENKLRYELEKLPADGSSVIVAHTPPLFAGDTVKSGEHVGSRAVQLWIERIQPKLWLCGHIHEDFSATKIDQTLVLNCACQHEKNRFQAWLIDTDTGSYEAIKM